MPKKLQKPKAKKPSKAPKPVAAKAQDVIEVRPQPGPQEAFLATEADICFYGGARGGGKTWALMAEALRHCGVDGFNAVFFRRTYPEITNPGGLQDNTREFYSMFGGLLAGMTWKFLPNAKIQMSHLQLEKDLLKWLGAQICLILWDQLETFSKKQFISMLSSNRSTCGVRPYQRATMNPDPDSWILDFIDWYINENGDPIQRRSGVIRWFIVDDNTLVWGNSKAELEKEHPGCFPLSFTFIPATLFDNKILMAKDPSYLSKLHALETHEKAAMLYGNWKTRAKGNLYDRKMFEVVDALPAGHLKGARGWDFAATKEDGVRDPDYTASGRVEYLDGIFYITDAFENRWEPNEVEKAVKNMASADGSLIPVRWEQEGGSAGKMVSAHFIKLLAGYDCEGIPSTGSKVERGRPFRAQVLAGNIKVLRGPWNTTFFQRMEAFKGEEEKNDIPDAIHLAFNTVALLVQHGISDYYRNQAKKTLDQAKEDKNFGLIKQADEQQKKIDAIFQKGTK